MTDAPASSQETTYGEAKFFARVNCLILTVSVLILFFDIFRGIYEWMRFGAAEKVILADWLAMPHLKWVGVQKIIGFVWGLPISVVAFAATLLFGWLWGHYDEQAKMLEKKK